MKEKKLESTQQELFTELKKLAKRANQRLVRLERVYGKNTWASRKLRNRLEVPQLQAFTKKGRVSYRKNMNITQLRATIKATKQFLNSQTSTKRGIERVKKTTIKGIAISLGTDDNKITDEEAQTFYDMFSDDFTKDIMQYIPPSDLWALIEDAVEQEDEVEQFIDRISNYINFGSDSDMINKLTSIYDKYVI